MPSLASIRNDPGGAELPTVAEWPSTFEALVTDASRRAADGEDATDATEAIRALLHYAERLPLYQRADIVTALLDMDGRQGPAVASATLHCDRALFARVVQPTLALVRDATEYLQHASSLGIQGMLGGGILHAAKVLGWPATAGGPSTDDVGDLRDELRDVLRGG